MNGTCNHLLRESLATLDPASFLPDEYRQFGELIAKGLAFFLERLSAPRLSRLLNEQLAMSDRGAPERLVALLSHCPTLHKLGQVVARDRRLAPCLRQRLQLLESMTPSTPIEHVREILRRELPAEVLDCILVHSQPMAEASVAVVAPFTWGRGDPGSEVRGVFKVLRPGVEERLMEELAAFTELGDFLDDECAAIGLPAIDYRETLGKVRDLLVNEVRLEHEQYNLAEAAAAFGDLPGVVVPKLLPFRTPSVTAMELVEGPTVAEVIRTDDKDRRRTAKLIVDALIAGPMFAIEPNALFHADSHAGNLLATPDGRLGLIDWSLAGHLKKGVREQIVQVILGGVMLNVESIGRAIEALSRTVPDVSGLRRVIADSLHTLRRVHLPGLRWLTNLMDRAALYGGVRFCEDLLLYRKTLLTLEGVIADLDASCPIDVILLAEASRRMIQEWPARLAQFPTSRAFSTHLSTFDVAAFFWSAPAGVLRFWAGTGG